MYKVTIKQSNDCLGKVDAISLAFVLIENYCRSHNCVYGLGNVSTQNGKINVTVFDNYNNPIELVIENA